MNVNFVEAVYPGAGKPISIVAAETHWSRRTKSNGFCRDTWLKLLKRVESDPNCRLILPGDTLDCDRPSTRDRKAVAGMGRPEVEEEDSLNLIDSLERHFVPDLIRVKDKIIAMVDGDHYGVLNTKHGVETTTRWLARRLGIEGAYLGERMGWVQIGIKYKPHSHGCDCAVRIFVRHGKGSATTFGTDVNALVRQSVGFDADLYIAGHTHRQWFIKVPHLYLGKNDIKQRFVGYARAGSLLRGFLYGQSTYAEALEYNPLSIGWPEVRLYFTRSRRGSQCRNVTMADMKGLT